MSQIRQAIECSEDQYAGTHFPVQNKKTHEMVQMCQINARLKNLDQKILIKNS
jgi:hypothetical protein